MQIINSSPWDVSIDEQDASLDQISQNGEKMDLLTDPIKITFPEINSNENLVDKLTWTVVDKGDSTVSLTMIDTDESYRVFPYHFNLMVTYSLDGPQLNISFYLKNNSPKKLNESLSLVMPFSLNEKEVLAKKIVLDNDENEVTIESNDLELKLVDGKVTGKWNNIDLPAQGEQKAALSIIL